MTYVSNQDNLSLAMKSNPDATNYQVKYNMYLNNICVYWSIIPNFTHRGSILIKSNFRLPFSSLSMHSNAFTVTQCK